MIQFVVDVDRTNIPYALYENVCSVAVAYVFHKSELQKNENISDTKANV